MMKKVLLCVTIALTATTFGANAQKNNKHSVPQLPQGQPIIEVPQSYELSKVRFAVDFGFSGRTGKAAKGTIPFLSAAESQQFINKMRYGLYYGASIVPFFNKTVGLGVKFSGNHYSASSKMTIPAIFPGSSSVDVKFSDQVNTFYIAPELLFRVPTRSRRNAWFFGISVGYVAYRETIAAQGGGAQTSVTGNGHGIKESIDIGFDIRLKKNLYLGLKLASTNGVAYVRSENETYRESLNAVEIGAGLRF